MEGSEGACYAAFMSQVFTVEILVTDSLNGTTPAPAIPASERQQSVTREGQVFRIVVKDLGLVGPDFLEDVLGSISTKYIPWIVLDGRGAAGAPGASIDVVDFDENNAPDTVYEQVASLDGLTSIVRRNGFYIYQGTALRLDGMTSAGAPIKLRFEVRTVENISDFAVASESGGGSQGDAGGGVVGVILIRGLTRTVFPTIGEALAASQAGDLVLVGPGDYPESVTIPAGVILESPTRGAARITGAEDTGTRVNVGASASIRGFTVVGPTDSNACIRCVETRAQVQDVAFIGRSLTSVGIIVAADAVTVIGDSGFLSGDFGRGLAVASGRVACDELNVGNVVVDNALVQVNTGTLDIGPVRILGESAVVQDAFQMNGGNLFTSDALLLDGSTVNGLHITADGVRIVMRTPYFDCANVDTHLLVDPGVSMGTLFVISGSGSRSKVSGPGAYFMQPTVALSFLDDAPGDQAFVFQSEVAIGSPNLGRELVVGEGDSFTNGMVVFRADDPTIGPFTDITNELVLPDGTDVALLPSTAVGATLYVGSPTPNVNIRTITTVALGLGGGTVVFERSNGGGSYDPVLIMVTDANAPYGQRAQVIFGVGAEQVRFGEGLAGFGAQAVNGVVRYWWRMRVVTAISTIPRAEQIKLGPNRFEVNADGFVERFGAAEREIEVLWHRRLEDDLTGSSPGNVGINFAAGINITPIDNNFQNGQTDGNGGIVPITPGIDTSRKLVYRVAWLPSTNGTGDVQFVFRYATASPGDVLNGTIVSDTDTVLVTVPAGSQDVLQVTEFDIEIPDAIPEDRIGIAFLRQGAAANDTYGGSVEIVDVKLVATSWQ